MPESAREAALSALQEQEKEYGTYVAVLPIDIDGVRAFNPGNPVPVGHVTRGVVDSSLVAKVGTKAAASVTNPEKA